jgi:ABC-2 type transport system ATP-binding protein
VAVMREGEIVQQGTPADLIGATLKAEIRFRRNGEEVRIETEEPTRVLAELTAGAVAEGRELEGLEVRRPTLEDVYLDLLEEESA